MIGFGRRLDSVTGRPSAIQQLSDDVLLYVYMEAKEAEASAEFIQLLQSEMSRRNIDCVGD